jgi:cyclase
MFPHGRSASAGGADKGTRIDALSWAKRMEASGAGEILVTSMDGDGTKRSY